MQGGDLVGTWCLIRSEQPWEESLEMTFHGDGRLTTCVRMGSQPRVVHVAYRIAGGTLFLDGGGEGQEERVVVSLEEGGRLLVMESGGRRTWLRRVSP